MLTFNTLFFWRERLGKSFGPEKTVTLKTRAVLWAMRLALCGMGRGFLTFCYFFSC